MQNLNFMGKVRFDLLALHDHLVKKRFQISISSLKLFNCALVPDYPVIVDHHEVI